MPITCDICDGTLVIDADGQYATCQSCGIKHSIERVRVKARMSAGIASTTGVASTASVASTAAVAAAPAKPEKTVLKIDEFRMPVSFVKNVPEKGLIVGGMVACGTISKDDELSVLTTGGDWKTTAVTLIPIDTAQTQAPEKASEGEHVLLMLSGLKSDDIKENSVLIGHPVSAGVHGSSEAVCDTESEASEPDSEMLSGFQFVPDVGMTILRCEAEDYDSNSETYVVGKIRKGTIYKGACYAVGRNGKHRVTIKKLAPWLGEQPINRAGKLDGKIEVLVSGITGEELTYAINTTSFTGILKAQFISNSMLNAVAGDAPNTMSNVVPNGAPDAAPDVTTNAAAADVSLTEKAEKAEPETSATTVTQTALNKVGQFLKARSSGASKSELSAIIDELEPQYETVIAYFEQHPTGDSSSDCLVGMVAYALASYYIEYHFHLESAETYSMAARTHLKAYLDQFGSTMNDVEFKATKSAYDQSSEYAAYVAYFNNRFQEVVPLMNDVYLSTTALGLTGATLAIVADMNNNPETSRAALSILERMDAEIKVPASNAFVEDVYRSAYTLYALMLATNAQRYPDAGFVQDIPKAVYCLRRGICLIHNEEYIALLQADINKYMAMF